MESRGEQKYWLSEYLKTRSKEVFGLGYVPFSRKHVM